MAQETRHARLQVASLVKKAYPLGLVQRGRYFAVDSPAQGAKRSQIPCA